MSMRSIDILVSQDEYDELAALGVVHAAHARLGDEPFRPETVAASVIARALARDLGLFHLPRASEEPS